MKQSAFMDIVDRLIEIVQADPPISPNVFRARDRSLAEQYDTAIAIEWSGSDPYQGAIKGAPVDRDSVFTVECWARTTTQTSDLAVDPLMVAIHARIMADTTLGGLVSDVAEPRQMPENTAEKKKTGWVVQPFVITHRTTNLTLEAP
ncbi:MAG: hypothetical protein M3Y65_16345 [Pseudomonadota bacterium]|nr:hypothetical protein [Pseudomonadota bacterium]